MKRNDKLYAVLGLGLSGASAVNFLLEHNYRVLAMDTRESPPEFRPEWLENPNFSLHLNGIDSEVLSRADEIIISPGLSRSLPALKNLSQPIISDVELFARYVDKPVIGITGSNGKSTVSKLVAEMLNYAGFRTGLGGNYGTPALDLLKNNYDVYVLELSSFQLESVYNLKLHAATILNISPDHLDRYPDLLSYRDAKQRIFANCLNLVINKDEKYTIENLDHDGKNVVYFSTQAPMGNEFGISDFNGQLILMQGNKKLLEAKSTPFIGFHEYSNALAALALVKTLDIPMESCLEALCKFQTLPHRCECVAKDQQVLWINDSKGTNVGATNMAILSFANRYSQKIILIAGGQGKNADFSYLASAVQQHVKLLIVYGEDSELIKKALQQFSEVVMANSLKEVVQLAAAAAVPGDLVLFSPACASFDMFKNYAHRGNIFKELVAEYGNRKI